MKFSRIIAKIEKFRFFAGLLVVGIFFVALSCFALSHSQNDLPCAEGTITRIIEYTDTDGSKAYHIYVSYTDDKGNRFEDIEYPSYSFTMNEGDSVEVLYDPEKPGEIQSPDADVAFTILLVIGIAVIAFAVFRIVKAVKKGSDDGQSAEQNTNSPFEDPVDMYDPVRSEEIRCDIEPQSEYYFHWTGKLNQSYILETHARQAIYEAVCDHIGVFTPYRYTFADRITGKTVEHKISHTVTTRYGHGTESSNFSAVGYSYFKIDDENIWEYIKKLGYSVVIKTDKLRRDFEILHYGVPVAYLEAAGVNILSDTSNHGKLGDKLTATGLFKVSCKPSDIEAVFLACFCVSRVEFL